MKYVAFILMFSFTLAGGYAQQKKVQHLNKDTNLIEVTYYHGNDEISQQGTFNLEGKLHGKWTSYDENGVKIAEGSYENGIKSGKWFFWSGNEVKEIIFENNSIASVTESKNQKAIVDKY